MYFEVTLENDDSLESVAWIPVQELGRPHTEGLAFSDAKKTWLASKTEGDLPQEPVQELAQRGNVLFDLTSAGCVAGDVLGCVYDADKGQASLYKNGKKLDGWPDQAGEGERFPELRLWGDKAISLNWGQKPFAFLLSDVCPLLKRLCLMDGRLWRAEKPTNEFGHGEGIPTHLHPDIESDPVDRENFFVSIGDVILCLEEKNHWLRHEWGWPPSSCFVPHGHSHTEADDDVEGVELLEDEKDSEKHAKVTFSLRGQSLWTIVAQERRKLKELSIETQKIRTLSDTEAEVTHFLAPNQQHQLQQLQLLAQRAGLHAGVASVQVPAKTCGVTVRKDTWHLLTISADLPFSMVLWLDGERVLDIEPEYPGLRRGGPFSLVVEHGLSFFGMKGLCSKAQKKWSNLGGQLREVRIALGHLPSKSDILQLHQPRGVWLCQRSQCERQGLQTRNSSTAATCWRCKAEKAKSGGPCQKKGNRQ